MSGSYLLKHTSKYIYLIVLGCLMMCKTPQQITQPSTDDPSLDNEYTKLEFSVAPEYARINATIMSIDAPDPTKKEPCNLYSCFASATINKVIELGSSFSHSIKSGDIIRVQFAFSMASSQKVFGDSRKVNLPGVSLRQAFVADIEGNPFASSNPVFVIYKYSLIE